MVLSLPLRGLPILDGVFRAMVVAGVAGGAVAVPFRSAVLQRDVLQRADFHAFAAGDAGIGSEERLVGDPLVEALPDGVGLEPREDAAPHLRCTLPFGNVLNDSGKVRLGVLDFTGRLLGLVDAHARHVDVRVRHLEAEVGVQWQTDFLQFLPEHAVGIAAVVAAGRRYPHVGGLPAEVQLFHEIQHQLWRAPRVDGEDESQALPVAQLIVKLAVSFLLWNKQQPFIQCLSNALGNKPAVPAARKV